ncbi:MAG: alpha/beta fold hydrolase [Tepidisphaeraceae bacterium]|jgi:pimeloyl-ACP methyl ester carboxylesterase
MARLPYTAAMPTIKTNGINMAFQERGQGEPLILIMGLGAPGSIWEEHVKEYERHFHCFLLDNRGAGDSDKPNGPYTTQMMAEDVVGLMDALKIPQARVAGISMGSAIAQELALAHPSKVRSMVLVSSWARCDIYTLTVFEHFCRVRAQVLPETFTQLLQLWIFAAAHYEKKLTTLIEGQLAARQGIPMPQHAFEAQSAACVNHDTLDQLDRINVPTLLTVGDADIFTPQRLSEEIRQRLPGSMMEVFKGCGHAHHWEDLARFNQITTDFLKAH